MPVEYVLRRPSVEPLVAPVLDDEPAGRARPLRLGPGGPLQVLAGPGAGKTTTLVELVVDRVEHGGLRPDEILVLTFSRKAAQEMRSRIARRLARTTATTPAMTFHSFCYALLRAEQDAERFASPMRLLSAPGADAVIAEVLAGTDPRAVAGRRCARRCRPAAWPASCAALMATARAQGMDASTSERVGAAADRDDWRRGRRVLRRVHVGGGAGQHDRPHRPDLPGRPAARRSRRTRPLAVQARAGRRRRIPRHRPASGRAAAGARRRRPRPRRRGRSLPVDLRIPRRRRARHRRLPRPVRDRRRAGAAPHPRATPTATARRSPPPCARSSTTAVRSAPSTARRSRRCATRRAAVERPRRGRRCTPSRRRPPRPSTSRCCCARPTCTTVSAWRDMAVLVRSGAAPRSPAAGAHGSRACRSRSPATSSRWRSSRPCAPCSPRLHAADALSRGETLAPDVAPALLTGPLGHLDAAALRRLGRALRNARCRRRRPASASRVLDRRGARRSGLSHRHSERRARPARAVDAAARLATLLRRRAEQIAAGESAEQVLWTVVGRHGLARRGCRPRPRATARAHRGPITTSTPCAPCSRRQPVPRSVTRAARVAEVARALEAQQIPADSIAQSGDSGEAVQLMTAHRPRDWSGRSWSSRPCRTASGPTSAAAAACCRVTGSSPDGVLPPPSPWAAAAEERRLFYVACSRARSRLVVTAVAAGPTRATSRRGSSVSCTHTSRRAIVACAPARGAGQAHAARSRCVARLPSCAASASRPRIPPSASAPRPCWRSSPSTPAGSRRPSRPLVGSGRAHHQRHTRCATPTSRCSSREARWTRCPSARCSGSSATRPRASAARPRRRDSARSSTLSRPRSCRDGLEPDVDQTGRAP